MYVVTWIDWEEFDLVGVYEAKGDAIVAGEKAIRLKGYGDAEILEVQMNTFREAAFQPREG